MITTRALKQFVYLMPGNATGNATCERVAEIIKTIEQKGRIVDERVSLCPEWNVTCKTSYPIEIPIPDGVVVVKGGNDKILESKPGVWASPSVETLFHLAKFGGAQINVRFTKFKRAFDIYLWAWSDDWKISISLTKAQEMGKQEKFAYLRQISEFFELPVSFMPELNEAVQREGLAISLLNLEAGMERASLTCGLSKFSFTSFFKNVMIAVQNKYRTWCFGYEATVPFADWISEINRAQLPIGKAEIQYTWQLRSHKHFSAMTEMAKLSSRGEAAQSLFEFEFAGKRAQLDLTTDKKGGFKFWFSFDAKEDQAEFSQLTGIKLRQWN